MNPTVFAHTMLELAFVIHALSKSIGFFALVIINLSATKLKFSRK
jgi:hypothetical protein